MRLITLSILFIFFYGIRADCSLNDHDKIDCGFAGLDAKGCLERSCCWHETADHSIPWCFFPASTGYKVLSKDKISDRELQLQLTKSDTVLATDIPNLGVKFHMISDEILRVKIYDSDKHRYEVPQSVLPDIPAGSAKAANYDFSFDESKFAFKVTRKSDNQTIFDTDTSSGLIFHDQFLQIATRIPKEANIYGLGEHVHALRLNYGSTYTLFTADIASPVDINLYGAHPYYMEVRNSKAHGVFLKNSNGMDITVADEKIIYKTIGGILDFYIFIGSTPDAVTRQYQTVIGTPVMQPFWSFGFHQCRYGFKSLDEMKQVFALYKENKIPLDTIWADIDYMDQYHDYSWDHEKFPKAEMKKFVDQLHQDGMKIVVIVDPGIPNIPGYAPFEKGLKEDVFIKQNDGKTVFIGKVWPGYTAYPDFLNPKTQSYWYDLIAEFFDDVPIDGLWIDMNEPSNFCNGACDSTNHDNKYNNPPYKINNLGNHADLITKTLDMDSLHYDGMLHYDVHNLYGFSEAIVTRNAMEKYYGKRPFILSRSTYPGSGHHVAHWLGDNWSTFESMKYSIAGALASNLFGIPMVGADICGFLEDSNEELCARWQVLGAFYTFSRNHNAIGTKDQYPYLWESVKQATIKSLNVRYSLIQYYYTLFADATLRGGAVMRPLFYEFANDKETLLLDEQFMIGSALLVSPCLKQGAQSVSAYFPAGVYYDILTYERLPSKGSWNTLDCTSLDALHAHFRGGNIIPMQLPAMNTVELRKNPMQLVIALDETGSAHGSLFMDDGEDLDVGSKSFFTEFIASDGKLHAMVHKNSYTNAAKYNEIVILGLTSRPSIVSVNGQAASFTFDNNVLKAAVELQVSALQSVEWRTDEVAIM